MARQSSHREPAPWDRIWMDVAEAIARRSKDPRRQHGAAVVDSYANELLALWRPLTGPRCRRR